MSTEARQLSFLCDEGVYDTPVLTSDLPMMTSRPAVSAGLFNLNLSRQIIV